MVRKCVYQINTLSEIDTICHYVELYLIQFQYELKYRQRVFVILQELLTNAIKYGEVASLHIRIGKSNVIIKLQDNGKGFDIESYMKKCEKNPIKEFFVQNYHCYEEQNKCGIGIFLARQNSDYFFYNQLGNKYLVVVKKEKRI